MALSSHLVTIPNRSMIKYPFMIDYSRLLCTIDRWYRPALDTLWYYRIVVTFWRMDFGAFSPLTQRRRMGNVGENSQRRITNSLLTNPGSDSNPIVLVDL